MDHDGPQQSERIPSGTNRGTSAATELQPVRELAHFLRFCQTVRNFNHSRDLLDAVACLTSQLLAARGSIVLLKDLRSHELYIPAACMEDAALAQRLRSIRLDVTNLPSQEIFQGQTPLTSDVWEHCPDGLQALCDQIRGGVHNRLTVPLRAGDDVIGAIWAVNKISGPFVSADADLLCALAGVTETALDAMAARRQLAACSRLPLDFDQARDRATHHLSHAIKTPLAVLIASLKLLEKYLKLSPLDGWQPIAQRAQRNLERLLTIEYDVEDILRQRDERHEENP